MSSSPGILSTTLTSLGRSPPPFTQQGDGLVIVVLSGPDAEKRVTIGDEPVVIGCIDECNLVLSDPTVSRRHLQIRRDGEVLHLEDLGSKNGSFVGQQRFERAEVRSGDEFRVGKTLLKVIPSEEVLDPEPSEGHAFGSLVGGAEAMRKLFALIGRVAPTSAPVLLEGETGVGKEVVAEEIHRRSPRADRPFVIFDCGAVPDELLESTLFGHVKGAFTGAVSDKVGVLSEADGGTIFLDEIGELKLELQPALLRVLDRGMIRPVGATSYTQIEVRVIAATHRNLGELIEQARFREDLYYRLAVVRLSVPPLRERREDLPLLTRHFMGRLGRPDVSATQQALDLLARYHWPGNVRELKNVVERALTLSADGTLSAEAIEASGGLAPPGKRGPPRAMHGFAAGGSAGAVAPAGAAGAAAAAAARPPRRPFRDAKAEAIESFERSYLAGLVSEFDNVTAAADAAGMDRKHLRTLLKRYGLREE